MYKLLKSTLLVACLGMTSTIAHAADLYVVSFTADWCPNCKVLDPALEKALEAFGDEVEHVVLDMTDDAASAQSFDTINGTILGNVYGDHLGVTGLAIMTAADSGEKLSCATRLQSAAEIRQIISTAVTLIQELPPGQRAPKPINCPLPNKKIGL